MKKLISFLAIVAMVGVIGCEDMGGPMGPGMSSKGMNCPFKGKKKGKKAHTGQSKSGMDMGSLLELLKGLQGAQSNNEEPAPQ